MAGIIAVYGLVVAVLIAGGLGPPPQKTYSLYTGFMHLAAGLSVGLSGLAAGYTIGVVGDVLDRRTDFELKELEGWRTYFTRLYLCLIDFSGIEYV
ncbi:vacuolar ATP synthase 16 kDa proteolipid subunit 2 [Histoplasma capsulatum]|uniref:Vacuolar ATP synthase 16 kDa proteolipid subunit 2 n=1 Tax=Ajellomyces capsulatus TaxID=5037 RepID=A0A8A1LZ18_AJECA|nr:vacuolar ATP synthase 16 kDa proteolipid subunit 2 [Histoplasma mississippiense (nom. inval.)]EDN02851.1 vacuolar ATP synthase 16 kDa proteolipid subunit 2 [Histoplasma mississippiense (nom. inval.)]QSS58450.1 vacuolar ATP synthase 16 kDa proteolipid subunit 2 [Histoplasma capsulatum]